MASDKGKAFGGEILVSTDFVVVFGQRINRPERYAPSQWLRYWEKLSGDHSSKSC
jgi:hypothetical protein